MNTDKGGVFNFFISMWRSLKTLFSKKQKKLVEPTEEKPLDFFTILSLRSLSVDIARDIKKAHARENKHDNKTKKPRP